MCRSDENNSDGDQTVAGRITGANALSSWNRTFWRHSHGRQRIPAQPSALRLAPGHALANDSSADTKPTDG